MTIQLVVGLGNPGPEYEKTRHNAGVWFVEELASRYNISLQYDLQFNNSLSRDSASELDGIFLHAFELASYLNLLPHSNSTWLRFKARTVVDGQGGIFFQTELGSILYISI